MTLSKKIINKIRSNYRLKATLALEFDKTTVTIENWLKPESDYHLMLTTPKAVTIIAKELGLSEQEILTEEVRA